MATSPGRLVGLVVVLGGAALLVRSVLDDGSGGTTELGAGDGRPAAADGSGARVEAGPDPVPVLGPVDTLTGIDGWLNTDAASLEEIRAASEVTVVQFWTFGCGNCQATLPHLSRLYTDFHDSGLEIVGVHSPELSHEADPDNVEAALVELDVVWPVALDTSKENFHRWQPGNTGYWPRIYVVDREGRVRFDHIGEGRYDELRETVTALLADT